MPILFEGIGITEQPRKAVLPIPEQIIKIAESENEIPLSVFSGIGKIIYVYKEMRNFFVKVIFFINEIEKIIVYLCKKGV